MARLRYDGAERATGYRRAVGSPRGEARRRELLERVTNDLAVHGLVDFSLRRAARAAGTTHKVLLYYFTGADDLLSQAVRALRDRRIARGLAVLSQDPGPQTLAARVRALWSSLLSEDAWVHDQAIGLLLYDPARYGALGRGSSQQYLTTLMSLCPPHWSAPRKREVAEMILATLRGFIIDRLASEDGTGLEAGFQALTRALEREEAAEER
jgi:AcrR family transcriptional regulator